MAQPVSTQQMVPLVRPAGGGVRLAFVWGAVTLGVTLGLIVLLAALALWYHYGTTVFFETISAGISACF
jgi:hypothetical protein